jgi:hypothetical protein
MTPANYLAAASFVPVSLAGVPLLMSLLSYFGTSGLSKLLCRSLKRSELLIAAESGVPPVLERRPPLFSNSR